MQLLINGAAYVYETSFIYSIAEKFVQRISGLGGTLKWKKIFYLLTT